MRPGAKLPISCMCRFSHGRPERAAGESIAASASCPKPAGYDQVTMLERKLVCGCSPKRVRSLFGRMDGSNRTVGQLDAPPQSKGKQSNMNKQVIINVPVADLPKSMAVFKALGYSHNPQSTDDTGACIVISDTILVMLLTYARFRDFTPKAICDTTKAAEVLFCLTCESRQEVDDLVAK